ncbi:hypothetical protein ACXWSP_09310, partial [Streptococcus pyogenes]
MFEAPKPVRKSNKEETMGTPSTEQAYRDQVATINNNASQLARHIIDPQMDNGEIITDSAARNEAIIQSLDGSIFDNAG